MTATAAPAASQATQPFSGHERCDVCPVGHDQPAGRRRGLGRTSVRASFMTGTLDFCKNHFEQHESLIREMALYIDDRRNLIQ